MFPRFARWVPANGIVFVALVIVAFFLTGDTPGTKASDQDWVSYYADHGNRTAEEVGFFLIAVSAICFLSFLGSLRGELAPAEGEPARLTTVVVGSGVAFIALAVASHASGTVFSWTATVYGERFRVDPQAARLFAVLGFLLFVLALFAAAAMTLAATVLALHTRVFPAWLTWLGALATIGGILGALAWPSLVVLVWILLVSLFLVWPRQMTSPEGAAPG